MEKKVLTLVLLFIFLILSSTNIFADVMILNLIKENSQLRVERTRIYHHAKKLNNGVNTLLDLAVMEYGNSLKTISYHLDIIWEDKDKQIQVYNYKVPGPLFHLGETIRLIQHAHNITTMYASRDQFFELLTSILCNSSFGDIIRAFNLVYGHIYAFGTKLGQHKIDNELIIYSQYFLKQISEILCIIEANGIHPKDQLGDEAIKELETLYIQLNNTVTTYLQKPGTMIW